MIIGVGTDLCSIKRMEKSFERFGRRMVERVLTKAERVEVDAPYLAKRFAAKEAAAKALGCGIGARLSFHDLIVEGGRGKQPTIRLSEAAQRKFPKTCLHLSMSDEAGLALAFVVAEKL